MRVVTGPPCAGKSTFVREAARPGDIAIDYDAIANTLSPHAPGAEHSHTYHQHMAARAARNAVIETARDIAAETDIYLIHTNPSDQELADYRRDGAEIVTLDPGIDEALERARASGRPQSTVDAIHIWYSEVAASQRSEHEEAKVVNLVTVPGVELMRTGTWELSSGPWECTTDTISAAVAAHDAGVLRKPVIRLGHNDPRFSGDPAVGWVDNVRASADGSTLLGDLVGVPEWLGDIMPSAYPSRSIEGMHSYTAPDGTEHDFVLTGLALLGATKPGVESLKSLQDVAQLYDVAAARQIGGTAVEIVINAAADHTKPYGDVDYADPGYQTDGVHRYPLDTPAHVRSALAYIGNTKNAHEYSPQQLRRIKERIANAAKKFNITVSAAADQEGGASMALSKEVAARLGVGPDATEADILAAIGRVEAAASAKDPKADDEEDDEEEDGDEPKDSKGKSGPNPKRGSGSKVAAAAGELITLEPAQYRNLVEAAEAGRRAEQRQLAEDDARTVDEAIREGKVAPARREHWITAMSADREGTAQVLASLAKGLVPVEPIGHSINDETDTASAELNSIHDHVMKRFGFKGGN